MSGKSRIVDERTAEFLKFTLRTAAEGLQAGHSEFLIRDEFTVQEGRLYPLPARRAKWTAWAALRIAAAGRFRSGSAP